MTRRGAVMRGGTCQRASTWVADGRGISAPKRGSGGEVGKERAPCADRVRVAEGAHSHARCERRLHRVLLIEQCTYENSERILVQQAISRRITG